ncbi:MAG: D-alanine--D-alanine ligase [Candidatus Gastranaerophilales bacterium]|nr:D-alanine--D-alanine ligase [Candidatus Gastranaerophilales bacterium]
MGNYDRRKYSNDTKIAVLAGGLSSEREVSLRSGKNVLEALKRLGYKNAQLIDVDRNIAKTLIENNIQTVYNALHGKYGEDGCIQGTLELLGIEYTGCGVFSSATCINKEYTKTVLRKSGLPLIKSVFVKRGENIKSLVKNLNYPLMLKPVCEGSSIGMYKVNKESELEDLYNESLKCNQDILAEEYIQGICATVGVLDDDEKTFATEILELRPKNEWYDYEAKYTKGMTEFILPAELTEEMTKTVKDMAIHAHKACQCKGVSRVDFLIAEGIPYILEINTSPGMTDTSDLPAQALAMGITYDELVLMILNNAGLNR